MQRQPLEEEEELVQAKEVSAGAPQLTAQFATAVSGMRGGGRPLSPSLRAYFEPRFGHDFSRVRVHTEGRSNETARAIHARAYTIGQDVVFGSGEYLPFATEGKRLIAHELAHVVQQDRVSTAKSPDWTSDTRSSPVRRPVSTNALSSTHTQLTSAIQRQNEPEGPVFPDVSELLSTLEENVAENLYNYGHHLYRISILYPGRSDLMEEAFGRYALGTNVLETGFMFTGLERSTAEKWALGTGIAFKGFNLVRNGELILDYQFDLGHGLNLETSLDLGVNPDDFTDVKKVDFGLGVVGTF